MRGTTADSCENNKKKLGRRILFSASFIIFLLSTLFGPFGVINFFDTVVILRKSDIGTELAWLQEQDATIESEHDDLVVVRSKMLNKSVMTPTKDKVTVFGALTRHIRKGQKQKRSVVSEINVRSKYNVAPGLGRKPIAKQKVSLEPRSLPSPLPQGARTGSAAGARLHPIYRNLAFHNGTDFPCPDGSVVTSVMDGYVTFSGWMGGYGYLVVVKHRDNLETWYGHLSRLMVNAGDRVAEGTIIALSGHTGKVTGPHLHFEIRCEGIVLDPMEYLI